MSHSIETKNCKICGALANRVQMGTFTKVSSKRWVGEDCRQWSGLVCPKCHADRAKVNMRKLRAERKGTNEV
jgi:hypothetical protein